MTDRYIPRILLCGDAEIFLRELGTRPIEFVGQIDFDDGKIFSDGVQIPVDEAKKLFARADYVIFDDSAKFAVNFELLNRIADENKFLTRDTFFKFAGNNFFAFANVKTLLATLERLKISRLLDMDKFFLRNETFCTFAYGFEVDGIDENISARQIPLVKKFYNEIYASFDDCRLQTYDAIILTADRLAEEIFDLIVETDAVTKKILLFVRKNSALERWLDENSVAFAQVEKFPAVNGSWVLLTKFAPPEDVRVYFADEVPEDLTDFKRYLGENLTALHWLWKNTKHATIGLVDGEISLSADEIAQNLRGCDMLVAPGEILTLTPHENTLSLCGEYLNAHVEKIFRKQLKSKQPEYLSAFDFVSNGHFLIPFGKIVTRRNIFDFYCAWLFSFVPDVTREVLSTTNLSAVENPKKYRVVAMISERLLTIWLAKNFLRLVPVL